MNIKRKYESVHAMTIEFCRTWLVGFSSNITRKVSVSIIATLRVSLTKLREREIALLFSISNIKTLVSLHMDYAFSVVDSPTQI